MTTPEARLAERGVTIEDEDFFDSQVNPGVCGLMLIREDPPDLVVGAFIRPETSAELRHVFAEWVEQRLDRFIEHGAEPDGWQRRKSDGGWQLWARPVTLPTLN